jgi:very-short-patch-repair endonuclease
MKRLIYRNRFENDKLRAQLAEIAPDIVNAFVSPKTVGKEVKRLLSVLKCRALAKQLEVSELAALMDEVSEYNYENLKELTKKVLIDAEATVQAAYIEKMVTAISSVEDTDEIVAKCKSTVESVLKLNSLPFMTSVGEADKYDGALSSFRNYLKIFPAWAATMLSLKRAAPCLPGVYSLAVIDEASQCDIPPMIPVLYRAQRIAIVGDPNQFPPVITLKKGRDFAFRRKYRLDGPECRKFAYSENSAFGVLPKKAMLLDEHFRCADGIAEYFNGEFYDGSLCLCCETGRTGNSTINGLKPGMEWVDAVGGDDAEIEAAIEYLKGLKKRRFAGTIGVISPLRNLVNRFKTRATDCKPSLPNQLEINSQVNTANGFQGGECDIILFLRGLNSCRSHGQEWYITAEENKYIYNVSVSRAKRLFVGIGDKKRAAASGLSYIRKLIPESRPPKKTKIGKGEDRLRIALQNAGVVTCPQYPVLNRYLDLAIPDKKIDIEVDGQAWHLDSRGCRKADDIHRDIQLEAAGWKVVRFWHYEVMANIEECVAKVKRLLV